MLRNISEFNGDALLVGGGWSYKHTFCNREHPFRTPDHFYAVDIDPDAEPDAVLDITDAQRCAFLPDARFSFIFFEHVPLVREDKVLKAFNIARRLLKEDGILIYNGASSLESASISTSLKQAGFVNAHSKMEPDNKYDNGSLTIATNTELEQIVANPDKLSPPAKYYFQYYKFLNDEPFETKADSKEEVEKYLLATQSIFNTFTPKSQKIFCNMYKSFFRKPCIEDTSPSDQADDYGSDPDCAMS